MSRARRPRSSPVALFPFMAVLVSTMGSLILLLMAINRHSGLRGITAAIGWHIERITPAEEELSRRRQTITADAATRRQALQSVEDSERQVEHQLRVNDQELRGQTALIARRGQELDRLTTQQEQLEAEMQTIHQQLRALGVERGRLIAEQAAAHRTFTPVVHPGTNGTMRRPIYIECTARALVIQPEEIVLSLATVSSNRNGRSVLAWAVRALCDYLAEQQAVPGAARAADSQPYPLLLVRPDGIKAYYAAREALEGLDQPFGYELIEADWLLRYPDPDPQARALVLAAIEQATGTSLPGFRTEQASGPTGAVLEPWNKTEQPEPAEPLTAATQPIGLKQTRETATTQPASGGSPARSSESPAYGSSLAPDENQTTQDALRRRSRTEHESRPRRAASTSADYRLPGATEVEGNIPIPRAIRADCMSEKLVLWPHRVTIAVPNSHSVDDVVWQLRDAIDREMAAWGPAGLTFRWEPQLVCRVHWDALDTFYRIRLALADAPVVIEHEIVLEDEPAFILMSQRLFAESVGKQGSQTEWRTDTP